MTRGKPEPGFEVEYIGDLFPHQEDKAEFGFRPLDVLLVDEVDVEDRLKPVAEINRHSGEESSEERLTDEEFSEEIEEDVWLASRYVQEGFDISNSPSVPWDEESYPAIQREFSQASISLDDDFIGFLQLLDDAFSEFETDFSYILTPREKDDGLIRNRNVDDYIDTVTGRSVTAVPDIYGVNAVSLYPQSFNARLRLYSQEIVAPKNEEELRENPFDDGNLSRTVNLNYDEDPIERLEEDLEEQGFSTERSYLNPSIVPEEFRPSH